MNRLLFIIYSLLIAAVVAGCTRTSNAEEADRDCSGKQITKAVEKSVINNPRNTNARIFALPQIPVLCYHRITYSMKSEYAVTPATFEAQIKMLADSGYHSILPEQLYNYLVYNKTLPEKPVLITFDDSRAEHFNIAAPVLQKYGFRGIFFIMTITYNKKNYMTKGQIAELTKMGHVIGLHSWDHVMVTKYNEDDWVKELVNPKKELERIIGMPVEYWAYPNGVYNRKAAERLSHDFKLSFILTTPRDSLYPLQTVRRMIVPEISAKTLLISMHKVFRREK